VWFLDIDSPARRERLVARRLSHDHPYDEAVAWVREVDERNALVVERGRDRADLVVTVSDAPVGPHEGAF
jgi:hypothetical protein